MRKCIGFFLKRAPIGFNRGVKYEFSIGSKIKFRSLERQRCRECGGSAICVHGKDKRICRECNGAAMGKVGKACGAGEGA